MCACGREELLDGACGDVRAEAPVDSGRGEEERAQREPDPRERDLRARARVQPDLERVRLNGTP